VPLTVSCSNASVTWDEISISPSSVKVQLEQRTQSDFVITVATTGTPANGYEVGSTEVVQGKTVQIAGSETMLNRIGQVIATVNVDRIRADQRLSSELKILDKNGDELKDAQMSRLQIKDSSGVLLADNSVMVDVYLWEVMSDIPVDIETEGRPADGYRVTGISTTPSAVNLVGTHDALDQIGEKLTLNEPISVEGATESFTVDYDISETLNEYSDLRLAKDVDPTVSVSVQIEKNSEQTIAMPLSSLDVSSRPENMTLTFSPADEISIVIEADDGSMPNIQLSDIRAGIDLSICEEPGTYEIPVEVQLPDGYQLASQVSLVVTATRQEQPTENQDEEGQN
jgi:YbbR domain-containing protein